MILATLMAGNRLVRIVMRLICILQAAHRPSPSVSSIPFYVCGDGSWTVDHAPGRARCRLSEIRTGYWLTDDQEILWGYCTWICAFIHPA